MRSLFGASFVIRRAERRKPPTGRKQAGTILILVELIVIFDFLGGGVTLEPPIKGSKIKLVCA